MRKSLLIAASAAAAAVSCTLGEAPELSPATPVSFEATFGQQSKVYLEDNVKCRWSSGDIISVFGKDGTNYWFGTEDYGSTAVFSLGGEQSSDASLVSSEPYALYPYRHDNAISGTALTTWIAPVQTPAGGAFPSNQPPVLAARATADGKLAFRHACALVRISTESEGVTAIVLQGENGEHLNGSYTYDYGTGTGTADGNAWLYLQNEDSSPLAPGTYYMVVPPTVFEKGLTVKLLPDVAGSVNYRYTGNSVTLAAGHVLNLGALNYSTASAGPSVTLLSEKSATVGADYTLTLRFDSPSGFTDGWVNVSSWETENGSWTKVVPGTGETSWWESNGGFNISSADGTSVTRSWVIRFPEAGKYGLYAGPVKDGAGNTFDGNLDDLIVVSAQPSSGGTEMISDTRSGLADGWYDISFTATRALSGGIVYATASSGTGISRMTPLRYGSSVRHVIRGVPVSGGSCTLSTVAPDGTPAEFSVSGIEYTPSSEWTWLQGGDFSRLNMELEHGVSYRYGGSEADPVDVAVENGWNAVRLRVFNDPGNTSYVPSAYMTAGYVCLADMLKLARKAKKAGLKILLSLHYSDYWTDPLIQNVPHEWASLDEAGLQKAVYDYTYEVLLEMLSQNTPPAYVAIGNETNTGMLYGGGTNGRGYNTAYRNNPAKFAAFFNKGAQAVRELVPEAGVVLHLANPHSNLGSLLSSLNTNSLDYDILGISYYPFWSDMTAEQFVTRADSFAATAGRKVFVMETGFNWSNVTSYGDAGQLENQGPYESVYPASPENQRNYLQELLVELKKSSSVIGVFYWDPLTVRLNTWSGMDHYEGGSLVPNHDNGTVTQNSALFDYGGNALDAWKAFRYNN